jgi:hypothetical protein
MKLPFIAGLALASPLALANTSTVVDPTYKLDTSATIYGTLALCVSAAQAAAVGKHNCTETAPVDITVSASPAPTPPPAGVSWGYYNGKFEWATDFSYAATIGYNDTSGAPESGTMDIKVISQAWGAWQPVMSDTFSWSTKGYTKLRFDLKPTHSGQTWNVFFVGVGDKALPGSCGPSVLKYGPVPVVGKWATYEVPLSDLCVGGGIDVYKFDIQDQTGAANNTWYVDNVGYAP